MLSPDGVPRPSWVAGTRARGRARSARDRHEAGEPLSDFEKALDARIRRIVDEQLARRTEGVYSSSALPPGCPSRRAFAEACRSGRIEGAEKHGTGRGATWTVAKVAWHRARSSKPPALRLIESATKATDADRADEMIAAAGFRFTKLGGSR